MEREFKQAFVSQSMDALYERFKEELFASSPMKQKLIVVPSQRIKDWLQERLSADCGVTMGLNFMGLSHAIEHLYGGNLIPHRAALTLEIDVALQAMLGKQDDSPLHAYMGALEKHTMPYERRLRRLSDQLCELFLNYERFGGPFLPKWRKRSGWIQDVFEMVHQKRQTIYEMLDGAKCARKPVDLHLFNISFMPNVYFRFLHRLEVSLRLYQLSPCQVYWGDVSRSGVLDPNMSNPLLANWGGMGKHMHRLLQDADWQIAECYEPANPGSCLANVQRAVLNSQEALEPSEDHSIEVCSVTSKLREVQVLKESLIHLLETSEEMTLGDIAVYAPDISEYAPFIKHVFEDSPFFYAIDDVTTECEWTRGLQALIQLANGRWEVEEVFELFSNPCVMRKCGLYSDDVAQLRAWAKGAHVRWGFNSSERDAALSLPGSKASMIERGAQGTWTFALEGLVCGLATLADDELSSDIWPLDFVEFSQSETLGKWIALFTALHDDLGSLKQVRSIQEWKAWLPLFCDKYLGQRERGFQMFSSELNRLGDTGSFSFEAIWERLQPSLVNQVGNQHEAHAIRFSSLKTGRAAPARISWLMGMNDGAFPRREQSNPLSEMQDGDPFPTHADEDRYLMLEILMQTKHKLMFSFIRSCSKDGKEQGPSILVEDLKAFCPSLSVVEHSEQPFESRYFSSDFPYPSYDPTHYQAALSAYSKTRKKTAKLFPQFYGPYAIKKHSEKEIEIDIAQMQQFSSHPLAYFLKRRLGIYLDDEEEQDLEFQLSRFEKFRMIRTQPGGCEKMFIQREQNRGHLPLGQFKELALRTSVQGRNEREKALEFFELKNEQPVSIQFDRCNVKPLYIAGIWHCPAIRMNLEGVKIVITGELKDVTSKGLLTNGKTGTVDLVRAWPKWLIANYAAKVWGIGSGDLLCMGNRTALHWSGKGVRDALVDFIEYYIACFDQPAPMMPTWAKAFMNEDSQELQKSIQTSFTYLERFFDPYLPWALGYESGVNAPYIIDEWAESIQTVYEGINGNV